VADNLGISRDLLYHWRKELQSKGELAFSGNGKQLLTSAQQCTKDLEKRLKDVEWERDILLKKALAIFSQTDRITQDETENPWILPLFGPFRIYVLI